MKKSILALLLLAVAIPLSLSSMDGVIEEHNTGDNGNRQDNLDGRDGQNGDNERDVVDNNTSIKPQRRGFIDRIRSLFSGGSSSKTPVEMQGSVDASSAVANTGESASIAENVAEVSTLRGLDFHLEKREKARNAWHNAKNDSSIEYDGYEKDMDNVRNTFEEDFKESNDNLRDEAREILADGSRSGEHARAREILKGMRGEGTGGTENIENNADGVTPHTAEEFKLDRLKSQGAREAQLKSIAKGEQGGDHLTRRQAERMLKKSATFEDNADRARYVEQQEKDVHSYDDKFKEERKIFNKISNLYNKFEGDNRVDIRKQLGNAKIEYKKQVDTLIRDAETPEQKTALLEHLEYQRNREADLKKSANLAMIRNDGFGAEDFATKDYTQHTGDNYLDTKVKSLDREVGYRRKAERLTREQKMQREQQHMQTYQKLRNNALRERYNLGTDNTTDPSRRSRSLTDEQREARRDSEQLEQWRRDNPEAVSKVAERGRARGWFK